MGIPKIFLNSLALLGLLANFSWATEDFYSGIEGVEQTDSETSSSLPDFEFIQISPGVFYKGSHPGYRREDASLGMGLRYFIWAEENGVGRRQYASEIFYPPLRSRVSMASGFEIMKTEVTQRQWEAVMGSNPSVHKGEDRPVERVSYHQIQNFLERLNENSEEYVYRLPTAEEFEYAYRGGLDSHFFWGDTVFSYYRYCWLKPSVQRERENGPTHLREHQEVARLNPNPFGLFDMCGNVAEWTQSDFFVPEGVKFKDPRTGEPLQPKAVAGKIVMGGHFQSEMMNNGRLDFNFAAHPGQYTYLPENGANDHTGFRLVRIPRN